MAFNIGADGLPAGVVPGLVLGTALGVLVGLAVRFHDGGPWTDAALVGSGFFALGFLFGYSRLARTLLRILRRF